MKNEAAWIPLTMLAAILAYLLVPALTAEKTMPTKQIEAGPTQTHAVFAGGCFWCMQAAFEEIEGVIKATSGYTGGTVGNPPYRDVSTGSTGHVEAVHVSYDPTKVSYRELVEAFFRLIDPTDPGGQFADRAPSTAPPSSTRQKVSDRQPNL